VCDSTLAHIYPTAWNKKGVLFLKLKQYPDALATWDEALEFDPELGFARLPKQRRCERWVPIRYLLGTYQEA